MKQLLSVGCALASLSLVADTITLRGNDPAGQSSFVTNVTGSTVGWSNQQAPSSEHDYVVDGYKLTLRTPTDAASTTRHAFVGKSLEIKGGAYLRVDTRSPASVDVGPDLRLTYGQFGSMDGWSQNSKDAEFCGTVSIGATSASSASFNTVLSGTWTYHLTVTGDADKVFRLHNNAAISSYTGGGQCYVRSYAYGATVVFDGDMNGYLGTVQVDPMMVCRLDSAKSFGGGFSLKNASKLMVSGGANGAQTVEGAVVASDAFVSVDANQSLTVGSLTSSFAPTNTFICTNSSTKKPENVYTGEEYVPGYTYERTHKMTWRGAYLNTLALGAGAKFAATSADLRGTLVSLSADAEVTVGDLSASNVVLQVNGGLVTVTDALTVVKPFVISGLKKTSMPQPVFRLKEGAGTLRADDFAFEGYVGVKGVCRYRTSVESEDGYQVLYVEDLMPGVYDATAGYVRMRYSESSNGDFQKIRTMSNTTLSYTQANGLDPAWSDGQNPHATTNYYCNEWIGSVNGTFAGRSMTQPAGVKIRIYDTHPIVNDWRFLPGSLLPQDINNNCNYTVGGTATLLSTRAKPIGLAGSGKVALDLAFVGDENASLATYSPRAYTSLTATFRGDMSRYYGEMAFSNDTMCVFQTSAENATAVLAGSNATLSVAAEATGPIEFDTLKVIDGVVQMDPTRPYRVKTLDLSAGARLTFAGVRQLDDFTGFEVSEACKLDGPILLDFNGAYPSLASGEFKLVKAPAGVTIDPSVFVVSNLPARVGFVLRVKTLGDGSQVLFSPVADFPKLPSAFDATTGYVFQENNDVNSGSVPYFSFSDGQNWSTDKIPEPGTNYYTKMCMRVRAGKQTFAGNRLVSAAYIRCEGNADITVRDLWLTPKPSGGYNGNAANMFTTEGNGAYTIRGQVTFFTTTAAPFYFAQSKNACGVELPAKVVMPPDAAFRFAGSVTDVPRVKNDQSYSVYLNLSGDTSECYGTALVGVNADLRLGVNGLAHGEVLLQDASSGLVTTADGAGEVPVAELTAADGGSVTVTNENVLALDLLTLGGTLTKGGTGALAVKTAVGGADAQLAVNAGAVCARGVEAFRNVSLSIGANGSILREAGDAAVAETGLLTAKDVTCGATLTVRVVPVEPAGTRVTQDVVLMTVPSAQAATLAGKISVRAKGYRAGAIRVSEEDAAGLKTLSTTIEPSGLMLIVR